MSRESAGAGVGGVEAKDSAWVGGSTGVSLGESTGGDMGESDGPVLGRSTGTDVEELTPRSPRISPSKNFDIFETRIRGQ